MAVTTLKMARIIPVTDLADQGFNADRSGTIYNASENVVFIQLNSENVADPTGTPSDDKLKIYPSVSFMLPYDCFNFSLRCAAGQTAECLWGAI